MSEVAVLISSSPASTRHSWLTLQAMGYLGSDGQHFWMLPRALLVAHAYLASRLIPAWAQPRLDALSEGPRESASLGALLDDDAIIMARSTARRSLSTGLGIGSRLPAYGSAMGRVLLANMTPQEAARRLQSRERPQLTALTQADPIKILALVDRCREEGYSSSDGELDAGVRFMAVPVNDRSGHFGGAMSIAVRPERMTMAEFREAFLPTLWRARTTLADCLFSAWRGLMSRTTAVAQPHRRFGATPKIRFQFAVRQNAA